MFSQACACIGEKCSGIALCTWGWRERCWAHLSFAASSAGSGPWWPQAWSPQSRRHSASKLCAGSVCPCFEAALHPLRSLMKPPAYFAWIGPIHKVVCICLPHCDKVFSHGKSIILSFICLQMLINRKSSSSRKHKAKSCWWAVNPTHFSWHSDTEWAPAPTKISLELGLLAANTCL